MRVLKFIVEGQSIKQDPSCDFTGLVPGTKGYIQAEFLFPKEWSGYAKVAAFYSALGKEYSPKKLIDGKYCLIPTEALERRVFKVRVIGKKGDSTMITNKFAVKQNGGEV